MREEKYGPLLRARLALDENVFDVNILVAGEPAAGLSPDLGREPFLATVKARVKELQQGVLSQLATDVEAGHASDVTSFWIDNTIGATVDREALVQLSERDDVIQIEIARRAPLSELLDGWRGEKEDAPLITTGLHPTWSVNQIKAPQLWDEPYRVTGEGVVVAVIDTGVNFSHPDLANRAWEGGPSFPDHGYNYESPGSPPVDSNGHGTSTASLVAGEGNQGFKTGAAPGAHIMALRVGSYEPDAVKAFQFALDHGAHVICYAQTWKKNDDQDRERWRRQCEVVLGAGVLHANSCGDQGGDPNFPVPYNIGVPGSCPPPVPNGTGGASSAMTCGAMDKNGAVLPISGDGPVAWETPPFNDYPYGGPGQSGLVKPDLCAPGDKIITCEYRFPVSAASPYVQMTGSSPAAGAVAGCMALLAAACLSGGQKIYPERIEQALEEPLLTSGGTPVPKQNHLGAGRVDVYAAYLYGRQRQWW